MQSSKVLNVTRKSICKTIFFHIHNSDAIVFLFQTTVWFQSIWGSTERFLNYITRSKMGNIHSVSTTAIWNCKVSVSCLITKDVNLIWTHKRKYIVSCAFIWFIPYSTSSSFSNLLRTVSGGLWWPHQQLPSYSSLDGLAPLCIFCLVSQPIQSKPSLIYLL